MPQSCAIFPARAPSSFSADRGVDVVLTPVARRQLDSIAQRAVLLNAEQFACIERFSIVESQSGHRVITLARIGASPISWTSDSVDVWAPTGFTHLCYRGHPALHTHSGGVDWPSEMDFYQAFEGEQNAFAALLVTSPVASSPVAWKVTLYAVRP